MNKSNIGVIIVCVVVVASVVMLSGADTQPAVDRSSFAQCLARTGAVMYGAEWCSHCADQKKMFGDAFSYVPYVECPDDPEKCVALGIEGYPTWTIGSSTRLVGTQSLERLSQVSGCPITLEKEPQ